MNRWTVTAIALVFAGLVAWVLVAFVLPDWLWHPLGLCTGTSVAVRDCKGYNVWSGIGSDIGEVTIIGGMATISYHVWKRGNCGAPRCWRVGLHPTADGLHHLCRAHCPDLPKHRLSLAEIHERHHAAKEKPDVAW